MNSITGIIMPKFLSLPPVELRPGVTGKVVSTGMIDDYNVEGIDRIVVDKEQGNIDLTLVVGNVIVLDNVPLWVVKTHPIPLMPTSSVARNRVELTVKYSSLGFGQTLRSGLWLRVSQPRI